MVYFVKTFDEIYIAYFMRVIITNLFLKDKFK